MNWKSIVDSTVRLVDTNRDSVNLILISIFAIIFLVLVPYLITVSGQRKQ